jgi:hypothetical protein
MARIRPPFINPAAHLLAHLACERGAADGRVVGAAHAAGGVVDFYGQAVGHAAAHALQLGDAEVYAVAGAAGTAVGARVVEHGVFPRPVCFAQTRASALSIVHPS